MTYVSVENPLRTHGAEFQQELIMTLSHMAHEKLLYCGEYAVNSSFLHQQYPFGATDWQTYKEVESHHVCVRYLFLMNNAAL